MSGTDVSQASESGIIDNTHCRVDFIHAEA